MKLKYLAALSLLFPLGLCAQNTNTSESIRKSLQKEVNINKDSISKSVPSKAFNANSSDAKEKTSSTANIKAIISEVDNKYLAGAVPEVNGRIVFSKEIITKKSESECFAILKEWLSERFKPKASSNIQRATNAHIVYAMQKEGISKIKCEGDEYLVFINTALALDQTRIHYVFDVSCKKGLVELKLSSIKYDYNETSNNSSYNTISAENQITDKLALNKKKTKLVRELGTKYRVHTIDLKDELFDDITDLVK